MPTTGDPSGNTGSPSLLDGGVSGSETLPEESAHFIAPSSAKDHNTLRIPIAPVACFRLEDARFAFDSSFVSPAVRAELPRLGDLIRRHPPTSLLRNAKPARPGAPLSVFGHADATGNDEYNKILAGRRARAIHALLTRDAETWNELHDQPHGGDRWDRRQVETMLSFLGRPVDSAASIERNPGERKALYRDYMEALAGDALPALEKGDFLGEGTDPGGKAAIQGCGEFNPLLVFSRERNDAFEKDSDRSARDEASSANRRVLIYIFRAGTRVDPARWPCPRASEGVAACRRRFWSDGEARRSKRLETEDREFRRSEDTFACRFYQRIADRSPCERAASGVRIRLYSAFGKAIPFAPFSVTIGEREPTAIERADGEGIIALPTTESIESCVVRWDFPPTRGEPEALGFRRTVFLVPLEDRSEDATRKRLLNLGYGLEAASDEETDGESDGSDETAQIVAFQLDYGHLADPPLEPTGELDTQTIDLVARIESRAESQLRESGTK